MNIVKFNNRPNEEAELKDGRKIWISRSPAVVGLIYALVDDEIYILTEKRSSIMDEPNKWSVISGYLDWDENGYNAIRREIYEETSFLLDDYKDNLLFDNGRQPFYVHTDPNTDAKQNISLSYIFLYKFDKLPTCVEEFKNNEISEIKWVHFTDIYKQGAWAFNHDERIVMGGRYLVNLANKNKNYER